MSVPAPSAQRLGSCSILRLGTSLHLSVGTWASVGRYTRNTPRRYTLDTRQWTSRRYTFIPFRSVFDYVKSQPTKCIFVVGSSWSWKILTGLTARSECLIGSPQRVSHAAPSAGRGAAVGRTAVSRAATRGEWRAWRSSSTRSSMSRVCMWYCGSSRSQPHCRCGSWPGCWWTRPASPEPPIRNILR